MVADLDAIREAVVGMRPRRFGHFTPDPHGPIEAWLNGAEAAILAVLDLHPAEAHECLQRDVGGESYTAYAPTCPTRRAIAKSLGFEVADAPR
jgi:hypothetical protein